MIIFGPFELEELDVTDIELEKLQIRIELDLLMRPTLKAHVPAKLSWEISEFIRENKNMAIEFTDNDGSKALVSVKTANFIGSSHWSGVEIPEGMYAVYLQLIKVEVVEP